MSNIARPLREKTLKAAIAIGQLNQKAGPSVNGVRLVRALLERGCDARLVHCTPAGGADERLAAELSDYLVALPHVHPLDPRWGLSFARHMRRIRPDVVQVNSQTQALVLAPIARLLGAATVYTMRNLLEYNAGWIQRGLKFVAPRFIDRFVGVSEAIADNIRTHSLSPRDPVVIYNGVEPPSRDALAEKRARVRRNLGVADGELLIGTCGRLSPDKEQIHLLEAAAMLKDRAFRMVVVGDGEMRSQMEAFCERENLGHVHFVGWQTDVNAYLAAMDVFAFHSMPHSEGLPTVVTEAAMMGLPLILADIACLREVYADEQQALFATPAAPEQFAEQLARVLDSPSLRETLSREARAVATEHFTIDAMADRYVALYQEIIA